jgi:hypothetical protein
VNSLRLREPAARTSGRETRVEGGRCGCLPCVHLSVTLSSGCVVTLALTWPGVTVSDSVWSSVMLARRTLVALAVAVVTGGTALTGVAVNAATSDTGLHPSDRACTQQLDQRSDLLGVSAGVRACDGKAEAAVAGTPSPACEPVGAVGVVSTIVHDGGWPLIGTGVLLLVVIGVACWILIDDQRTNRAVRLIKALGSAFSVRRTTTTTRDAPSARSRGRRRSE